MSELIRVGMADYKICRSPDQIATLGLGSCIGVAIYSEATKWCGLAHVMLPDSKKSLQSANRMKFADTCLLDMYEKLLPYGGESGQFYAKIAGGAQMFSYQTENKLLNIGEQNRQAVYNFLREHKIPIVAEDVGKDFGRTIRFDPERRTLHITAMGVGEYVI